MGWQDRRYDEMDETPGGRVRRALRRVFVEGDDFFSWSVPLFRAFGISVRIHIFYIVFIIGSLIWPMGRGYLSWDWALASAAFSAGALFLFVLLHEFGHCFACRHVGGEADRIVMWPLGGLAYCRPPHNWKADLITVIGGPAVNLALIPVLGAALLAAGAPWGAVIYNPFDLRGVFSQGWFFYPAAYWKHFLWSAYHMNLVLFGFNMLLVMYPMDAGRILQSLLWRKIGYRRSLLIAANVGLVTAVVVGTFAMLGGSNILFSIALFCGITCFFERRRAAMIEDEGFDLGSPAAYGYGPRQAEPVTRGRADREFEKARKRQQAERDLQAEVDRILDKIKDQGMQSLTRAERRTLEEDTRRKREAGGGGGRGGTGGGRDSLVS